jgi:hypothetical protein
MQDSENFINPKLEMDLSKRWRHSRYPAPWFSDDTTVSSQDAKLQVMSPDRLRIVAPSNEKFENRVLVWNTCPYQIPIGILSFSHLLVELSPSWEDANCAATRELPSILWNPKVHYRLHKSLPPVPILSQVNPIHTIPSYLSKINFNIVHPPTSWSS